MSHMFKIYNSITNVQSGYEVTEKYINIGVVNKLFGWIWLLLLMDGFDFGLTVTH